jgi:hypothetical protein
MLRLRPAFLMVRLSGRTATEADMPEIPNPFSEIAGPAIFEPDEAFMAALEATIAAPAPDATEDAPPLFLRAPSPSFMRALFELGGASP